MVFSGHFQLVRTGIQRRAGFDWAGRDFYRQVRPKNKRSRGVRKGACKREVKVRGQNLG